MTQRKALGRKMWIRDGMEITSDTTCISTYVSEEAFNAERGVVGKLLDPHRKSKPVIVFETESDFEAAAREIMRATLLATLLGEAIKNDFEKWWPELKRRLVG